MANTATIQLSLQFVGLAGMPTESLSLSSTAFTVAGNQFVKNIQSIPTTAGGTAINLGGMGTPLGLALLKNLDTTNYVQILSAASGTVLLRLLPGEAQLIRFDNGVTAPAAQANSAPVLLEYMILQN